METHKHFLIVNLIAGQGRCRALFPRVREELDRRGIDYDLHYTNEPLEATDVAKMGIEAGFTRIVAMGGDGTVSEVANGLVDADATLAVIPAGTGNDFVRMMGIPNDPIAALDLLAGGVERTIDLGRIADDRCFVNGVGIGIDAQVARDVLKMERLRGAAAYIYAAVKEVFRFKAFKVVISSADWSEEIDCISLGVANGRFSGGGFKTAPLADLNDGLIDIVAIGDFSRVQRLFRLPLVRGGRHINWSRVRYHQTEAATISSPDKLIAHIDGEPYPLPREPFKVEVLPDVLRVLVPG